LTQQLRPIPFRSHTIGRELVVAEREMDAVQQLQRRVPSTIRHEVDDIDTPVLLVQRRKEWHPHQVVPVGVTQHQYDSILPADQVFTQGFDTGPRIEDQHRSPSLDTDAGRVSTYTHGALAGNR
jgi:hypothetical protein